MNVLSYTQHKSLTVQQDEFDELSKICQREISEQFVKTSLIKI